jgi:hypothetical protein
MNRFSQFALFAGNTFAWSISDRSTVAQALNLISIDRAIVNKFKRSGLNSSRSSWLFLKLDKEAETTCLPTHLNSFQLQLVDFRYNADLNADGNWSSSQ